MQKKIKNLIESGQVKNIHLAIQLSKSGVHDIMDLINHWSHYPVLHDKNTHYKEWNLGDKNTCVSLKECVSTLAFKFPEIAEGCTNKRYQISLYVDGVVKGFEDIEIIYREGQKEHEPFHIVKSMLVEIIRVNSEKFLLENA